MKRVQRLLSQGSKFESEVRAIDLRSAGACSPALRDVFGRLRLRSDGAESKPAWQANWERTVKAAEAEGQLTVYIAGYSAVIDAGVFQKAFPKIKVTIVTGNGHAAGATDRRRAARLKNFSLMFIMAVALRCIRCSTWARCSIRFGRR